MNILGISAFYHDSAACVVKDGQILAAAQEERFTRKRHDASFPKRSIDYCLKSAQLTGKDLDYVAFYDKPFLKFERILETYLSYAPLGLPSFLKAIPLWLKEKLWIKDQLREELKFSGPLLFTEHHESHAASSFYPSPFDEAALITMDGVGEWATASFGIGKGATMELQEEIRFPHSLGLLYSAFTYFCGFRVNSGEYKLMGLAPYGKPKYRDLILKELVDLKADGSFKLNMSYFEYPAGLKMTSSKFDKLFGLSARVPETKLQQIHMDLARSIQDVTEEIVVRIARHVRAKTGMKNLCLAGGVALNCVANGAIVKQQIFDEVWIQPAAGDAGGALGAALFVYHQILKNSRHPDGIHDSQKGSYLGPAYENKEIQSFLDSVGARYEYMEEDQLMKRSAELIASGHVLGWFQGRMEFGPRALGARSILGDARSAKMQAQMNLKIKYRESFRPFAPSVLKDSLSEHFELSCESPYMLLTAPVQPKRRRTLSAEEKSKTGFDQLKVIRSEIPAVTHVDDSARVQTVDDQRHPRYYRLLQEFQKQTGCPVLINTSFNVRGEPIVATPEDAFRCFMRTAIDHLVIGNFVLTKAQQKNVPQDTQWQKEFELD